MLDRIKKYLNFITGSRKECLSLLSAKELDLVSRIRQRKLTYLTDRKIVSLIKTCQSIEENNLSGIFLEAGCALGGSAILIASLKSSKRPFFIYDAFETIPRPTKDDTQDAHDRYKTIAEGKSKGIGHEKYYGYEKTYTKLFRIT